MTRLALAAVAFVAASAAAAQTATTEAQARIYVWSALTTGAAHAIVSPSVELAPQLRDRLALAPQADRDQIYEALVTLTRGWLIRVRAATADEAAPLADRAGEHPVFMVEGGASPLIVAYDLQRDQVALIGVAGAAWSETQPQAVPATPAPRVVELPAGGFLLKPIHFRYRDAALSANAIAQLDGAELPEIAAVPGVRYVIRGHSDRLEADEYQQSLSERRAQAVRDYLAERGVAQDQMRLVGFGASISLTACAQRDLPVLISCLAPDRRVTVEVVPAPR